MAFTCGFFNAVMDGGGNPDRAYDAKDMSRIFDGLIQDGVYAHVGEKFAVTINLDNDLQVKVGTGRAWLSHTWSYNDSYYYIYALEPEQSLNRIDALCIHVKNGDTEAANDRINTIEWKRGTGASNPSKPIWANTAIEGWYPLAYVTRHAGVREVVTADIEQAVGVDPKMPFVLGVLDNVDVSELFLQWTGQFQEWMDDRDVDFDAYLNDKDAEFMSWLGATNQEGIKKTFNDWFVQTQNAWDSWFATVQADMDEQTATRLANKILELNARVNANGAKNYAKPEKTSGTTESNGIIFVHNSDGTISVAGNQTSTGVAILDIKCDNTIYADKTSYKLYGCPAGGSASGYICIPIAKLADSDTWEELNVSDIGAGSAAFNFTSAYDQFGYRIKIASNYTIQSIGLTFYPMICLATETDTSYKEYVPTNKVLLQAFGKVYDLENDISDVNDSIEVLGSRVSNLDYYIEQTKTLSTSNDTVFTFTNDKITTTSVIDVASTIFKAYLKDVSVTQNGICTVTYGAYSSAASLTCRIYIHN